MMYLAAVSVIIVTTVVFVLFAEGENETENIEFLSSYGWTVNEKLIEKADVIIPKPFDLVYESYNKIQLSAGLDLEPYMGMRGVRYTYEVTNYPRDVGENVRANVICIEGKPVAGDIMTVSLQGFMHSLNFSDALK